MADRDFNYALCEKRHEDVDRDMQTLFTRLNWFYVITILTLGGVIGQYFVK